MEATSIYYSTKAKSHELAIIKLKSLDLSALSPEALTNKYLEIYSEIFQILENNRLAKK